MSTELAQVLAPDIERVVIGGDLSQLKPEQRLAYYKAVCDSVGLNPLTKPFDYITLNGKLILYALKGATDQLRSLRKVSINIVAREVVEDCYVVTARATTPDGRTDENIGAVSIANLKGDTKCNALMKCETKAKRRVTLSICGLGMLDETEIETIPTGKPEVPTTKEPRTFKRQSAPANSGQEVREGVLSSEGAETSTGPTNGKAENVPLAEAGSASAVDPNDSEFDLAKQILIETKTEYIPLATQRNFWRECKKAMRSDILSGDKDILIYQWLRDHGYHDQSESKVPGAEYIPAAGWLSVRAAAIEWLKKQ